MAEHKGLSEHLREAIQASGRSLNQLGQTANVDAGRLSRFMRGERSLTIEAVSRLCQALGLKFCPVDKSVNPTDSAIEADKPSKAKRAL